MRYTSGVDDDLNGGRVDSWTVFDAQYSVRFGRNEDLQIAVGALNIFDTKPPAAAFTGYLPSLHDAIGRQAYIRATASF